MSDFKSSPSEFTSKLSSSYPGSNVYEGDLIIEGDLSVSGSTTGISSDVSAITGKLSSSYAGSNNLEGELYVETGLFVSGNVSMHNRASNCLLTLEGLAGANSALQFKETNHYWTMGHRGSDNAFFVRDSLSTTGDIIQIEENAGDNLIYAKAGSLLGINTDDPSHTLSVVGGISGSAEIIGRRFSGSHDQSSVFLGDVVLGTYNAAAANLLVSGSVTVGPDADGTDRMISFGHSTLKTVIGIDDSHDVFAINTDNAFETGNDFEIDTNGNVTISHGQLQIAGTAGLKTPRLSGSSAQSSVLLGDLILGTKDTVNANLTVSGSVTVDTDTATATALTITADSFTGTSSGGPRKLINISTNTSDTDKIVMLSLQNDHASATGCTPVSIRQDAVASGTFAPFMKLMAGGTTDYLEVKYKQLQITVSTSGTTTTSSNFFEANAVPFLFSVKVTTAIGNNGYISKIGVPNDVDVITGTLNDALLEEEDDHLVFSGFDSAPAAGWPINGSAQNLVIEHNAQPDAGVIYVDMWYYVLAGLGG